MKNQEHEAGIDKYYNYNVTDSEDDIKNIKRKWKKTFFSKGGYVLKIKIPLDYLSLIRERQRELNMNSGNCQDYLMYLIENDLKLKQGDKNV